MANTSWRGSGRKWTLKAALAVGPIELVRMDTRERAELANFLRNQFQLRMSTFRRAGVTGYAEVKLRDDMEGLNKKFNLHMSPDMRIMTRKGRERYLDPEFARRKNPQNALATYVTLMQDFFTAKSSTVKGWRAIGEAQDRRLFGETTREVPVRGKKGVVRYVSELNYRMTDQERINFWKVYREVYRTGWTSINSYSSNDQREFASKWMSGTFNRLDLEAAMVRMLEAFSTRPDIIEEHPAGVWGDPIQQDLEGDDL